MGPKKQKATHTPLPQVPSNTVSVTQAEQEWKDKIKLWYPDWETRTYFVPPVFMGRTQDQIKGVEGQTIADVESSLSAFHTTQAGSGMSPGQLTTASSSQVAKSTVSCSTTGGADGSDLPSASTTQTQRHSDICPATPEKTNRPSTSHVTPEKSTPTTHMTTHIPGSGEAESETSEHPDINPSTPKKTGGPSTSQMNPWPPIHKTPEKNTSTTHTPGKAGNESHTRTDNAICPPAPKKTRNPSIGQVTPIHTTPDNSTCSTKAMSQPTGVQSPQMSSVVRNLWQAASKSTKSTPSASPLVHESSVREDFAQQHVLYCLQKLVEAQPGAMFIISQLGFSDYLNKPAYAAAAAQMPTPASLPRHQKRGDFDVLIIHRDFGILVGEIKAIGLSEHYSSMSEAERDAVLVERVERAVGQLEKADSLLRHLVKDIAPRVMIRKTLILPYIMSDQLQRILRQNTQLNEDLRHCLEARDELETCTLCVSADILSSPSEPLDVSKSLQDLQKWWSLRMACEEDPCMSSDVYLSLLARFCGPATTVTVYCPEAPRLEIRTEGEAIAELGRRMSRIFLTTEQVDLLNWAERLVCVTGPPGTGKTILLVLIGLRWLRRGKDVHVVSTKFASYAVCKLIEKQLNETLSQKGIGHGQQAGKVLFHDFDFWNQEADIDKAITTLRAAAKYDELYVLLDEVSTKRIRYAPMYERLVTELDKHVNNLHLWAAAIGHDVLPSALKAVALTVPLRCTPVVVNEINKVLDKWTDVHKYASIDMRRVPTLGLEVQRRTHKGDDHTVGWPVDCFQCGKGVGKILLRDFGFKAKLRATCASSVTTDSASPQLDWRDVFILTRSSHLQDDVLDEKGDTISSASEFVQGLRAQNIPVQVLSDHPCGEQRLKGQLSAVALSENDQGVVVARYGELCGLERKIVVVLPGRAGKYDEERTDEFLAQHDTIFAMTRCSSKLVIIDMPPAST